MTLKNDSDGKLIEHVAQRGETANEAFSQLVERYGNLVLNACHRSLLEPSEAEDAAQAVFLVLWKKADRLLKHMNIAAWLHRVSQHVCSNANRSTSARKEHEMKAGQSRPTRSRQWDDIREVIDHELDRLPAKYRPLLILVHFQGHSIEEAAKLLDSNASTLRTQLSRARELLRRRLVKRGFGMGAAPIAAAIKSNANAHMVSREFVTSASSLPTGAIPQNIETLAEGAITTMAIKSLSTALAVLAIAITTIGTIFAVNAVAKEKVRQTKKIPDVKTIANGSIVVVPFTTELQRLASPTFADADYLIEVNGKQLLGNKEKPTRKEAEQFDYTQLEGEFKAIEGFENAKVVIRVLWPDQSSSINGLVCQAHFWLTVKELCDEAVRSDQQVMLHPKLNKQTWSEKVASLSKKPTKAEILAERSTGDNQVGVYPLHTPLSRMLYGGSDCVVHLVHPLEEAKLSAIASMEKGVAKLNLKQKDRITFLFARNLSSVEASQLEEEFFGPQVWGDRLGFSRWQRQLRL